MSLDTSAVRVNPPANGRTLMHKWDSSLSIKRVKKPPTTPAIPAPPPVHNCHCSHARFNHRQWGLCYCELGCEVKTRNHSASQNEIGQPVRMSQPPPPPPPPSRKFKPDLVTHLYEFDGLLSVQTLIDLLKENFEPGAMLLTVEWERDESNLRVSVVTVQDDK